jgi:hypothetical protein
MRNTFLILYCLLIVGCASAGNLDFKKPLKVNLNSLGPVYVSVTSKSKDSDWKNLARSFESRAIEGLKTVYSVPVGHYGPSVADGTHLKMEVVEFYRGNRLLRALPFLGFFYPPNPSGETKLDAVGQILNIKTGEVLASFELESTSEVHEGPGSLARNIAYAAGEDFDRRTNRAIYAAVEELKHFLGKVK